MDYRSKAKPWPISSATSLVTLNFDITGVDSRDILFYVGKKRTTDQRPSHDLYPVPFLLVTLNFDITGVSSRDILFYVGEKRTTDQRPSHDLYPVPFLWWPWTLTLQVSIAEIYCSMWVRNGLQIKGQAMTYIQCHFCYSMVDADLFLMQVRGENTVKRENLAQKYFGALRAGYLLAQTYFSALPVFKRNYSSKIRIFFHTVVCPSCYIYIYWHVMIVMCILYE